MIQRKCFLGTTRGIMAYEGEESASGQLRFHRVMHALPDKFFGQAVVDINAGLVFVGSAPGEFPLEPGMASGGRAKPGIGPLLYRSGDGGRTWEPSDEGITGDGIKTIALAESTGYLYAGGDGP